MKQATEHAAFQNSVASGKQVFQIWGSIIQNALQVPKRHLANNILQIAWQSYFKVGNTGGAQLGSCYF